MASNNASDNLNKRYTREKEGKEIGNKICKKLEEVAELEKKNASKEMIEKANAEGEQLREEELLIGKELRDLRDDTVELPKEWR